jgi:bile acid:Na+ symporter, BASS family
VLLGNTLFLNGSGTMKNPVATVVQLIHRYFIWMIVASYFVAAVLPAFGLWTRNANLGSIEILHRELTLSLPLVMLASLLFNAGLGMKIEEAKNLLRNPLVLLGGVFGNLAIPLSFIIALSFAMKLWHNPEEAQLILVGLAFVAAMPIAGSSTAWTQNANGNLALSLGLVLLTTFLSPLLSPLVLHAVGFMATGDYSEDLHELASNGIGSFLGTWVILPSLLGILSNWLIGERRLEMTKPYVKLINYCILVLLNYSNASLTLPTVVAHPDMDFLVLILVITVALCLVAFMSGYLLGRVLGTDRNGTISLLFGLGMNNNGSALVLASMAMVDHPLIMLPIIFYNLAQHLVASLFDFVMFRRQMR